MPEAEHVLQLTDVVAGYGDLEILHGVSLTVERGEIVALIGSNGAGKTTLMRTVTGLLKVRSGDVRVDGHSLRGRTPERIVAAGVSLVPEGRRVFAGMTVEDNLMVGGRGPGQARRRRLAQLIDDFPALADKLRQDAGSLSGGQQQLMVIARALMGSPSLLLLDEPSLGLSPIMAETVFEAVRAQQRLGVSVLIVEQNVVAGLQLADRGNVIESGQIVRSDDAGTLLADPSLSNSFLGATS